MAAQDKLTIDTPEQIALEFTLASAGSRFLALALDTLIQTGVFVAALVIAVLLAAAASTALGELLPWMQAALVLGGFVLYYAYFALFEAMWSGQTPGKRAVGVRVISTTGRPIGVFDAIIRNLLRIVDQMPGIYGVGILSIFFTERNQRLGDLAAGTVVVHDRKVRGVKYDRPLVAGAVRIGANRLTPDEIQTLETFLDRRDDLPPDVRDASARRLAEHVRKRLSVGEGLSRSDESLLEDAVAEYRSGGRTGSTREAGGHAARGGSR